MKFRPNADLMASVFVHLMLLALIFLYSEVHQFDPVAADTVPVEIVTPQEVGKSEIKPDPVPSPSPTPEFQLPSSLCAFTRPVAYRMAYGTVKHEHWHEEMGEKAKAGELLAHDLDHLRHELDAMAERGALPANLRNLRAELAGMEAAPRSAAAAAKGGNA